MTTVHINIPDDQAAALKAKAAAAGLTLEDWFQKMARQEAQGEKRRAPRKSAFGLLARYSPGPSDADIEETRREMFQGFAEDAP